MPNLPHQCLYVLNTPPESRLFYLAPYHKVPLTVTGTEMGKSQEANRPQSLSFPMRRVKRPNSTKRFFLGSNSKKKLPNLSTNASWNWITSDRSWKHTTKSSIYLTNKPLYSVWASPPFQTKGVKQISIYILTGDELRYILHHKMYMRIAWVSCLHYSQVASTKKLALPTKSQDKEKRGYGDGERQKSS